MIEAKTLLKVLEQMSVMLRDVYQANPRSATVNKSALAAPIIYLENIKELFTGEEDDS